jgi:Ca2+-binding EF-hand superfamily protein
MFHMLRRFFATVAVGSLFVGGLAASHLAFAEADGPAGGPRGGRLMAMIDANKDGVVTKAELTAALEARFAKLDVNHDGKLDQTDRDLARQQRLDARFAALDADHNGQISKAEFVAGAQARREKFADMRKDGAGGRRWGGRHHGGAGGLGEWGRGGAGKNGVITKAEFMARPLAMFDKADANHDGKVTADEIKVARDAMRQEMRARWQDRRGGSDAPPAPPTGN